MVHNHWPVGPEPQLRLTSVCDGIAFVAWVNSYHDHTTEEGQIALHAEFKRTMVLKPDGAGGSRASMRKRWLERLFCLEEARRRRGPAFWCVCRLKILGLGALERPRCTPRISNLKPAAHDGSEPCLAQSWAMAASFVVAHHHPSNSTCITSPRKIGREADRRSGQPLEHKISRSHATA
jgi:hypothetical protein